MRGKKNDLSGLISHGGIVQEAGFTGQTKNPASELLRRNTLR